MSVEKIQTPLREFSAPLHEATILQCQHTAYEKWEAAEQCIKEQLNLSKVNCADESGLRVEGKNHWLHTLGNENYTYVYAKRGYAAHEPHLSMLHLYRGWLVHNFYAFYFHVTQAKHALCDAHVLRGLASQAEVGRLWAKQFRKFQLRLYEKTEQGNRQLLKIGYK